MANRFILALDLDFTLARFRSGYAGIYQIVTSFGISAETAEKTLRNVIDSSEGMSFERYASTLFPADSETAKSLSKSLEDHFERDFDWYESVPEWLRGFRMRGIPIILVTAGAAPFQEKKIRHLGFEFDEIHITDITQGKGDAIRSILERHPDHRVTYVDDKLSELVRIRTDVGIERGRLTLFHIVRGDAPER